MDILAYFNLDDGLEVTWYHAANSHEKLDEALETTMMIEGDITLRWVGFPNQVIFNRLFNNLLKSYKNYSVDMLTEYILNECSQNQIFFKLIM